MSDADGTPGMHVSDAVTSRRSVRGFLPTPVDGALLRRVVATACRAPSGGNVQPWHLTILGGEETVALKSLMRERIFGKGSPSEVPEYQIYPSGLQEPYRSYRFALGEALYAELGIPRENKAGRAAWFAENFQLFGAPVGIFCSIDRGMGPPQWSDLGMFLQTLMLLLREAGLDSCPQECWSTYPQTLGNFLRLPPQRMLFCGMAVGYADPTAPANRLRPDRAPLEQFAEFRGI